ncbi:DNA-binding protein [Schinkia azotoformans]|uniref:DNA-binding protein n=1 Tax=Schinkia azotoformans TaxID=1454 RepID=UPI002E1BD01E|nr:DNA-binding protein [Schinkia azotoformans]
MEKITNEKVMLSVKDIMEIMGIGRDASYKVLNRRDLPTTKNGRKHLVYSKVFYEWLKKPHKI